MAKTFDVQTRYATYKNCYLVVGNYRDKQKHIYIGIYSDEEGPIADLTVNVPDLAFAPEDWIALDTNNFPEGVAIVKKLKLGKITERFLYSGFCAYPVVILNMDALKKWGDVK